MLRAARVDRAADRSKPAQLAADVPKADAVARIFINLERPTPPAALRAYGPRLVPSFNYLQTAACLFADDVLGAAGVMQVARSLIEDSGYTPERLLNSLADIVRRGHLRRRRADPLRDAPGGRRHRAAGGAACAGALARAGWNAAAPAAAPVAAPVSTIAAWSADGRAGGSRGMSDALIVLVTVPSRADGERIAEALVGEAARRLRQHPRPDPLDLPLAGRDLPRRRAPAADQDHARALRRPRGARQRAAHVRDAGGHRACRSRWGRRGIWMDCVEALSQ